MPGFARRLGCIRRAHAVPGIEDHFGRVVEIGEVHRLELMRERLVLDDHVELAVPEPAGDVEIGRSDAGPASVRHGGLRVQHRAVPFEHAHAGFEQRPVSRPREQPDDGNVRGARHEQPDVDAIARRRAERLHVGRGAGKVRVRQPERVAGQRRDELIEAKQPGRVRHRRHDADGDVSGREGARTRRRSMAAAVAADRPPQPRPRRTPPRSRRRRVRAARRRYRARAATPRAGSPTQACPTHSPVTNATVRSTVISFR